MNWKIGIISKTRKLEFLFTVFVVRITPRSQHNWSQLSGPLELILHSLPVVPIISFAIFFVQKFGLFDKYSRLSRTIVSRTFRPRGLISTVSTSRFMTVSYAIRCALSYFSFSAPPITAICGISYQQVLLEHEPETPWHLHDNRRAFFATSRPAWLLCKFILIFAIFARTFSLDGLLFRVTFLHRSPMWPPLCWSLMAVRQRSDSRNIRRSCTSPNSRANWTP